MLPIPLLSRRLGSSELQVGRSLISVCSLLLCPRESLERALTIYIDVCISRVVVAEEEWFVKSRCVGERIDHETPRSTTTDS